MRWNEQSRVFRIYFAFILALSLPAGVYSFIAQPSEFSLGWASLTFASLFVATINLRLPKISSVISMGDVFVILSLLYFGSGPALVTYWIDTTVGLLSDVLRKHGTNLRGKILPHRFLFNLSCCALSIYAMELSRRAMEHLFGETPSLPVF